MRIEKWKTNSRTATTEYITYYEKANANFRRRWYETTNNITHDYSFKHVLFCTLDRGSKRHCIPFDPIEILRTARREIKSNGHFDFQLSTKLKNHKALSVHRVRFFTLVSFLYCYIIRNIILLCCSINSVDRHLHR